MGKDEANKVNMTSGYTLEQWPLPVTLDDASMKRVAIFGIRGGLIGSFMLREEDIDKVIMFLESLRNRP